jgi:hypothetical protein
MYREYLNTDDIVEDGLRKAVLFSEVQPEQKHYQR